MAKDQSYFFSHDVNASSDPKIIAMEEEFGVVAYAWWWKIIEKLAVSEDYKLPLKKYTFMALAKEFKLEEYRKFSETNGRSTVVEQKGTDNEFVRLFIFSLINDFDLLNSDDDFFWSPSLTKRMTVWKDKESKKAEQRRLAGIKSGEARRKKKQNRTVVEQNRTVVEQNELIKQNKTKEYIEGERDARARDDEILSVFEDEKIQSENPSKPIYDLYMKKLGEMSPIIKERIDDLISEYGRDATIVAINTTHEAGGNSIKYVETVAAGNLKKEAQKANGSNRRGSSNRTVEGKTDGSDVDWSKVEAKL